MEVRKCDAPYMATSPILAYEVAVITPPMHIGIGFWSKRDHSGRKRCSFGVGRGFWALRDRAKRGRFIFDGRPLVTVGSFSKMEATNEFNWVRLRWKKAGSLKRVHGARATAMAFRRGNGLGHWQGLITCLSPHNPLSKSS